MPWGHLTLSLMTPRELLTLLAHRAPILRAIADGYATKRSLKEEVTVSRSTINRAIDDFETAQLVKKAENEYELTTYGWLVWQEYRRVIDRCEPLAAAIPLLSHLPAEPLFPGVVFDDTTIYVPDSPNPNFPLTQFERRVRQSETIIGVGTSVTQRNVEFFLGQIRTNNLQLSMLLEETVVDYLWQTHPDALRTVLQNNQCTLWSVEQTPSYSLAVVDSMDLWLGSYNDHGQLQGLLLTESPAAVAWAEERLQQYIEQATPICR